MASKANIEWMVNAGGGWSARGKIAGHTGALITQADISSITRTITDTATNIAVTDSITVSSVVWDTLQTFTNAITGATDQYNFFNNVPASKIPSRRTYKLQYTFTPTAGEVFKTVEVDIIGD